MARAGVLPLLAAVVLVLVKASLAQEAPLGAFLGCFDFNHATTLAGVREQAGSPFTGDTLYKCPASCRQGNFSLTIISPQLRCWCALATPNASYQLPGSACDGGGPGVAVFYQHDDAATRKCRVVPTPLTPEAITVDYNQHNVEFTPASPGQPAQMRLQMQGSSGARVQPKCPRQMYGQFEATAKATSAAGAVTAFYVRDSDWYDPENKGDFEEIDVEFLNANPAIPNSVWLNSYHRGLSRGERLVKPEEYQRLLNLSSSANNTNTWLTYTFTWQPSHVMWAINGVPVLKRTAGELVRWADMKGKPFERIFVSPDKPMHVSFSIWSDQSRFHFGGELDYSKSPYQSYIRELRRIACEERILANDTQPYGPAWLYVSKAAWPKPASPSPTPKPSPKPSPAPTASQLGNQSRPANTSAATPGGKAASSPAPSTKAVSSPTPATQGPASLAPVTPSSANKSPAPTANAPGSPAPAMQRVSSPAPAPAPAPTPTAMPMPKVTTSPSSPGVVATPITSSPPGSILAGSSPAPTAPVSPSKVVGPPAPPAAPTQSPAAAKSPVVNPLAPPPPPVKASPTPNPGKTPPSPSAPPSPPQAPGPAVPSRSGEAPPSAPKPAPPVTPPPATSPPSPPVVKPAAPIPTGLNPVPASPPTPDTLTTTQPKPPATQSPPSPPPPPPSTRPPAATSLPTPAPPAPVAVPLVEAPPTILPVVPPPVAPAAPSIAQAPSASVLLVPAPPSTPPAPAPAPPSSPASPTAPAPVPPLAKALPPPPPVPSLPQAPVPPATPPSTHPPSPPAVPATATQPTVPTPPRALLPNSHTKGQAAPPLTSTAWQVNPPGSGPTTTPALVPSASQPLTPHAGPTGYGGSSQFVPQVQQPAGGAAGGSAGGMFGLSLGGRAGGGSGSFSLGVHAVIPSKAGTTPVNFNTQLQLQQQQQQQQQATGPYTIPAQPLRSYPGIAAGPIYTGTAQPSGVLPAQGPAAVTQGPAAWGYAPQPGVQQQYVPQGLQGRPTGFASGSSNVRRPRTSRRWLQQVQDSFRSARDAAVGEQGQWTEALAAAF